MGKTVHGTASSCKRKNCSQDLEKRVQVNEDMVHEFFDRLEKEIEDVSPANGHGRKRIS